MKEIKKIGVVGAGQMGRGIAQVAAMSAYDVVVYDISAEGLEKGINFIKDQLNRGVDKGKWDASFVSTTMARLSTSTDLKGLSDCDLVVEAATENKKIKFEIFKNLDEAMKPDAILATNTSSISITEIAAVTKRAKLVAGMHFMNPVPVMKLVEGIRGLETTDETFDTVAAVAEKMGKVFVRAEDVPGFAVNRILMPMINEAVYALYEGVASVEDIDTAMKLGTNQPMGPLTLADFIGLDTCLAIMEVLHDGLGDTKYRPCPLLKKYVLAGRLGKKVGRGFYEY
ncbi:3-hydroxybutyryl-CoA dehydrogenase [Bacteriovorax sp. BSW11_IV]|uniref:3-hydroxybutyryl-CoA dehydrogenase n=1 Tax=Bacteriovorax sp. BSW11_IV TaxID=1353529 RepID=UPI00038A452B|nr:3-hydroxybutyryl-CoA dehydrogenase [Bacteriovorax sp. BSW11_IV]EQC48194.1 3-hydroxybutyryl-CoA dehydrogenase [Bacteriovorax sp. BSW11_IV]